MKSTQFSTTDTAHQHYNTHKKTVSVLQILLPVVYAGMKGRKEGLPLLSVLGQHLAEDVSTASYQADSLC